MATLRETLIGAIQRREEKHGPDDPTVKMLKKQLKEIDEKVPTKAPGYRRVLAHVGRFPSSPDEIDNQ